MAFPKRLSSIHCEGFPKTYLPALKNAIENKQVKWGKTSVYIDVCDAEFEWAGCKWGLSEIIETVDSIVLINGIPNHEDLTAAISRG
jgi:hypothetical protein